MVYATLVQYFCDIPASDAVTFLGMPISGKILIYSMALQVIIIDWLLGDFSQDSFVQQQIDKSQSSLADNLLTCRQLYVWPL